MRTDLPDGTVTLLLTDIEGSTRLLHRLGTSVYADALGRHRALLRDAFARHGGIEVDTQGDAFFVAFPTAVGALGAAIDAQRALSAEAWPQGASLKVRMGVHTGAPQRTAEGYVGIDVHAAARIASSGHGGQILLSARTVSALAGTARSDDVFFRELGEHRLKDLDAPQRLAQAVVPDLPADFPALRSLRSHPNNLPTATTPFLGRARLVAELHDLILDPHVRLVTLTGPGGTGKSRLALRVATELLSRFADGVFFVPLVAVRDAEAVAPAIAAAVGVREADGASTLDAIAADLAEKDVLLLIDNFEQVQSAARDVATLLSCCPRLNVIVTSREALRIASSRAFAVPSLELPPLGRLPPVSVLSRIEAVSLFVERARAVRPEFVLDEQNAEDVVAICRKVDALPLAIELAAARVRTMSPDRLRRALDRRLKVLTTGGDDLLAHQKTLRDLIAWSYELLAPDEQRLWRRLATFSGGCTVQAAQTVCDLDGDLDVELDCESLVAKSLLAFDFGAEGSGVDKVIHGESAGPRISMLETLREFAMEKLAESPEHDELAARHVRWFKEIAETAEARLRGPHLDAWMRRLDADHANLRVAVARGLANADGHGDALSIAASLWYYWYQRGLLSEGRDWLERTLETARGADDRLRARALLGVSSLARQQGLAADAARACEQAVAIYRGLDDREGLAIALSQQGAIAERSGDLERAGQLLTEALAMLRATSNRERIAFTLIALGVVEHVRGDLARAAACYEESLAIGREIDDKNAIATALVNLAEVAQQTGDAAVATERFRASLRLYAELGLRNAIAHCLEVLAGIDAAAGRADEAAVMFGAAERIREEIGAPVESFNAPRVTRDLGAVKQKLGESAFEQCWRRGRNLDVAEAVELAMRDFA